LLRIVADRSDRQCRICHGHRLDANLALRETAMMSKGNMALGAICPDLEQFN
jgi:hypothetical protein